MNKPKITVIPPNPAPKQLTAFIAIKKLRDHAMAFWNANNPNGAESVKPEPTLDPDIAGFILDSRNVALAMPCMPLKDDEYVVRRAQLMQMHSC